MTIQGHWACVVGCHQVEAHARGQESDQWNKMGGKTRGRVPSDEHLKGSFDTMMKSLRNSELEWADIELF